MAMVTYLMKTRAVHRATGVVDEFYSGLASNYTAERLYHLGDYGGEVLLAVMDPEHEYWLENARDILECTDYDDPDIGYFDEAEWDITIVKGPFQVNVPELGAQVDHPAQRH